MKINNPHSPGLKPPIKNTLSFVAEWVSVKEMKAPQRPYEELLSDLDKQVWKELSVDWQGCLLEKEECPAL